MRARYYELTRTDRQDHHIYIYLSREIVLLLAPPDTLFERRDRGGCHNAAGRVLPPT